MQNTCCNSFKAPAALIEKYDEQLRKYGFRGRPEVLLYLATGIWNERNRIKNSRVVQSIINRISIERSPVLRVFRHVQYCIWLRNDDKQKLLELSDFGCLSNLMNAAMEAFLISTSCEKRSLRKEIHARFVYEMAGTNSLQTCIAERQYVQLVDMAQRGGLTLTGLLRSIVEAVLMTEGMIGERWLVPFEIQDAMQNYLRLEGFTLRYFSNEMKIYVPVGGEVYLRAIQGLMRRYQIPGLSEFTRRILLFLLNSSDIPFQIASEEERSEETYFDENELYINEQLSRKDFIRSIYQ